MTIQAIFIFESYSKTIFTQMKSSLLWVLKQNVTTTKIWQKQTYKIVMKLENGIFPIQKWLKSEQAYSEKLIV